MGDASYLRFRRGGGGWLMLVGPLSQDYGMVMVE